MTLVELTTTYSLIATKSEHSYHGIVVVDQLTFRSTSYRLVLHTLTGLNCFRLVLAGLQVRLFLIYTGIEQAFLAHLCRPAILQPVFDLWGDYQTA